MADRERIEQRRHLEEFRITEKRNRRLKLKAGRENSRRLKKELKEEFRQRDRQAKLEWAKLSSEDRARAKKARLLERKERKKQLRLSFKDRFSNFINSFRSLNIRTLKRKFREFRESAPKRRRLLLISFNSTVLFLLSYLSLFLISQAVTVITASFFNYPTTLYYYEIYFNISPEAWYHDSVKTIFSAGPLVNFVIGITFLIIYTNIKEWTGPFKLFFLWGFLHAVNMLFGAMLIGTLFETGVGHVISWMYIMDTGRVLYSIISIFLLVIAGLLASRQFLISGNTYYNEINRYNRSSFVIAQVLLPFLAGNVILVILRQPRFIFYDTFIAITLVISILPVLVTYRSFNDLYFEEEEKVPGISWLALVLLTGVVLIFRGLLEIGIQFGG
ncbi:MAG: hypothetical protein MUC31_04220 [Bacteroidales bacterium]|nr:hypothetical protein [Bacteroidales bacterium]